MQQRPYDEREASFLKPQQGFGFSSDRSRTDKQAFSLEESQHLLRHLLRHHHLTLYKWDLDQRQIVWENPAGASMPFALLGNPISEKNWLALIDEEEKCLFENLREKLVNAGLTNEPLSIDYRITLQERSYTIRQTGMLARQPVDGSLCINGTFEIQESTQAEAIGYQLPTHFLHTLQGMINQITVSNSSGALILVSINNLSMIMNGYGYDTAEDMIRKLVARLRDVLTPKDMIMRLERDQLAIILANAYKEETENVAFRISHVIQNYGRETLDTAALHVICTVGSVLLPSDSTNAQDALNKAYVALSSQQSGFYRTFESTHREADQCRQQMGLANYLHKALKDHRIRLAYQPVIESKTGRISHYEALLRMVNAQGKISSAGALIPIAERMGLIDIIDTQVLEMVVDELRNSEDVHLAFNVSNMTTENSLWLDTLTRLLKETPDISSRLIVEITETAAHNDLSRAAYFVASLQSMGCQVALDDFGSGYTSFRQLKALSVDFVKIDGVFVKDLAANTDNRFFVKTLLDFSQAFGLKAVAEFVENGEIAKILLELGVDYMQGYYFGKPENHRSWLNRGEYRSE